MSDHSVVTIVALILGVLCFLLYAANVIAALTANPAGKVGAVVSAPDGPLTKSLGAADIAKLIEAVSKLTDSLGKASPALVSLAGAVLFLAIAAISDGALTRPGDAPAAQRPPAGNAGPPAAQGGR